VVSVFLHGSNFVMQAKEIQHETAAALGRFSIVCILRLLFAELSLFLYSIKGCIAEFIFL
jgi:hypothetical protein